ncbi:histidine kinase [Reichenbachiella agariperforans]|uniref:histidine kinase n=1 Tax=Reichenbachiella agariperforans TaxID=156994 RepID=UPI001C08CBAB|nr:histidine kinase [Reichenbachiella agariperforans]MBU2916013.1 histidine kinase [Reichenbachiella agariperforans]
MAYYKYCTGEMDSSIFYFKNSAQVASTYNDPGQAGRMINNAANLFEIGSQLDSSLIYYDSALFFADFAKDTSLIGSVLIGKGIVFQLLGLLNESLINYQEAEKLEEHLDVMLSARLNRYTILLDHFPDQMNYEELFESFELARSNSLEQHQASLIQFIGNRQRILGEYKSAHSYYDQGIELANNLGRPDLTAFMFVGKGKTALDENLIEQAIVFLDSGRILSESNQLTTPLIQVYTALSKAYLQIGELKKCLEFSKKAIEISESHGQKEIVTNAYENMAKAYALLGKHELAFEYQQLFTEKSQEILDQQKSEQLTFLQTKYETEKITNERNLAEERATVAEATSRQNLTLFIAAVVVAFLIIISAMFYFSKLKQAKKTEIIALELRESQQRLALEKQYRDSELKALKAQMNPHFIFNVLNSIQEFIVLNKKDLASDYLSMFAELIRSYLHFSNSGSISLRDEVDTLEKYLKLETLRFEDTFSYDLQVDEGIYPEEFQIPTMIIQPYVENAIKHGLFHKSGDRKLTVAFTKPETDLIQCIITDNGIGRANAKKRNEAKGNTHKSFAMEATASRLELYNEKSKNKIGIETIDLIGEDQEALGTQVILTIPLIA